MEFKFLESEPKIIVVDVDIPCFLTNNIGDGFVYIMFDDDYQMFRVVEVVMCQESSYIDNNAYYIPQDGYARTELKYYFIEYTKQSTKEEFNSALDNVYRLLEIKQ
jgi:hypothetical protein